MTYKEALELNESKAGLNLKEMPIADLMELIEEIPGWDYPLGEESVLELARRAEVDVDDYFSEGTKDYSDLWAFAAEKLGFGW
jgi:hypothetical protein